MYHHTFYWKLPQGAFFGTEQGRTLESALDAEAEKNGSAAGVWHVVCGQAHYIFREEQDARRFVASRLAHYRRLNRKDRREMAERLAEGVRMEGDLHPGPMNIVRGIGSRHEFNYTFRNEGLCWKVRTWAGMMDTHIHLFQRTEEMEQNRRRDQRARWERVAEQAKRVFERGARMMNWTDWTQALNGPARAYGEKNGLLPGGTPYAP